MTVSIQTGFWDDPATWSNGVPAVNDPDAIVDTGHTVTYRSNDPNTPIGFIIVEEGGSFIVDPTVPTAMLVDTIHGKPGSYIEIENLDNNIKSRIVWDTSKDIDPAVMNFTSRGITSHGDVKIVGAEKTHVAAAQDVLAGSTTITLDIVPVNWKPGDRIGIAATYRQGWIGNTFREPESEEVTIVGIQGKVVSFFPAVQHDHTRQFADKPFHVTNHTRNICFESADPSVIHWRGHAMFMSPDCQEVRWAEFRHMGRTDKSQQSYSVEDLQTLAPNSNIHGRYPLHAHLEGVDLDAPMTLFEGCVVAYSPGWGIVAHQSKVGMINCVAFDCFGASFMWEDGSEVDMTVGNVAMLTRGIDSFLKDAHISDHDNGKVGVGFYWQSRGFKDVRDNISCDHAYGYGFQHRFAQAQHTGEQFTAAGIFNPKGYNAHDTNHMPIENFDNNLAYACKNGIEVIKANPQQFHMLRTDITNFCAWEITNHGIFYQYTGNYTTKNFFVAGSRGQQFYQSAGLRSHTNTYGMVFADGEVHNFEHGAEFPNKTTQPIHKPIESHFKSHLLNVTFTNVNVPLAEWNTAGTNNPLPGFLPAYVYGQVFDPPQNIEITNFVPSGNFDVSIPEEQLCWPHTFPSEQQEPDGTYVVPYWSDDVVITPTITDSIDTQLGPIGWNEFLRLSRSEVLATLAQHGYWFEAGVPYFKWPVLFEDRYTGEKFLIDLKIEIKNPINSAWKLKLSAPPMFDFRTAGQPMPTRPTIVH